MVVIVQLYSILYGGMVVCVCMCACVRASNVIKI